MCRKIPIKSMKALILGGMMGCGKEVDEGSFFLLALLHSAQENTYM